jgi:hypothetical protein
MKDALLSASDVSRMVPSTSTMRRSFTVWYEFCVTPQHMPEELFDTIPAFVIRACQYNLLLGGAPCSWPRLSSAEL